MFSAKVFIVAAAVAILAVACSAEDDATAGSTPDPATTRSIEAPEAEIVVDGDASDWDTIAGLELTLEPIPGVEVEPKQATLKVARDSTNVYLLLEVDDDYDWTAEDAHELSAAIGIQWAIDTDAAEAMGAEEVDQETSLGMVDIWHWELECATGIQSGGAVSDAGEGKDPGNDDACNFDDEWATTPENREDDNGSGAENSLLGVFTHSEASAGVDGTYVFEMSRPLQTGDAQDAQFESGETARVAVAYWDPDNSPEGWVDEEHVQSANQGWIEVEF